MPASPITTVRSRHRPTGPFERAIVAVVFAVVGWFASTTDLTLPSAQSDPATNGAAPQHSRFRFDREHLSQQILPIELDSPTSPVIVSNIMADEGQHRRLPSVQGLPFRTIASMTPKVASKTAPEMQDRRAWNVWQRQDALLAVRPMIEGDATNQNQPMRR